jgi:hypothetical protein
VEGEVVGGHEAAYAVIGVGQLFTDFVDQSFREVLQQALPGILGHPLQAVGGNRRVALEKHFHQGQERGLFGYPRPS